MKICFAVLASTVCVLSAQTPNLSGVWKLDAEKSKIEGPGASQNMLAIFEQKPESLTETLGTTTQRGEQRSHMTYRLNGRPSTNSIGGMPMRATAKWEDGSLVIDGKIYGQRRGTIHEKITLAPDGTTLTVDRDLTLGERSAHSTLVFLKQPE